MLEKFLKEVVVIIVGKPAEGIVDLLNTKKHVNEFIIAKKLDLTINQTRNILYKIADQGLVSFVRKKDKKKGWYTYFWKIEILKSLEFLKEIVVKKINQINQQINSRETKQFYVCERCNIEVAEETALLYNFTCNECGEVFTLKDNSKVLKELKKSLIKLEGELKFIDGEIDKEKEKIGKEREKELLKVEKERAEKRASKRAEKKASAKKVEKKKPTKVKQIKKKISNKKVVKKKLVKKKTAKKNIQKKGVKKVKKKITKKKIGKKSERSPLIGARRTPLLRTKK